MRCRVARAHVEAALERELPLEARFELDEHTARCRACAEHERRTRVLQELLEGPGDPAPTPPDVDAAARAVFAALERPAGPGWRPRRPRRVRLSVLGAMVLAAGALLTLDFARRGESAPPAPPPTAAHSTEQEAAATDAWSAGAVESAVRSALLACFLGEASADIDPPGTTLRLALERFLVLTREPSRAGWPVRRFVEGLLDCPDATIARGAVQCLGALGDPSAVPALERVLRRAGLAPAAFAALGNLGDAAVGPLERALAEPGLAAPALRALCRIGGERPAAALERAARRAAPGGQPARETLLDALTSTGPSAVASLLRLADECAEECCDDPERGDDRECAAILARLPLVAGAGPELARLLERERHPLELLCRALVQLQPPEALPWLEERCGNHRERALALETLASFEGPEPLASVLRLDAGGRLSRDDVVRLLENLLERSSARAEPFTRELIARGDAAALHAWLTLLLDSEHPGAAPSLARLAFATELPEDDQQWAALAVGELGAAPDAALLAAGLEGSATSDRRRSAACLLSIHALSGPGGVAEALAPCSPSGVRRVLDALQEDGRAGAAIQLHRVARALEGALSEAASAGASRKEIL